MDLRVVYSHPSFIGDDVNPIQTAFNEWSDPITGLSCDMKLSSHGRAFEAGYIAALKNAVKICNDLAQHYGHTIAIEQCIYEINKQAEQ